MNWFPITGTIRQLWEEKPNVVALFVLGFAVFVYIVLDTWKCKHRDKHKHPPKY